MLKIKLKLIICAGFAVIFSFGVLTALPALAQTGVTSNELLPTTVQPAIGLTNTDVRVTIARIIRIAMGFIGIGMVAMIIYGGFVYMTSGGNDEQAGSGKKAVVNGVIGLAIVLSAYALTTFIINQLVQATA